MCLCRIDALRTVRGCDKAVIGIIRLALIGRRVAGLRLRTGTRIRRGGRLACRGLVSVPLITYSRQVAAFLLCHQTQIRAYRNGLRHRIQGVEERAALVVIDGTRCCVTVAYYVMIIVVEDMRTGSHFLCSESRSGLGTCIRGEDKERLPIRRRPPFIQIVPYTSLFLGGIDGVTAVTEQRCRTEHTSVYLGLLSDSRGRIGPRSVGICFKLGKVVHGAIYIAFDMPQARAIIPIHIVIASAVPEAVQADDGIFHGIGHSVGCLGILNPVLILGTREVDGEDKSLVVLDVVGGSPSVILTIPFDDVIAVRTDGVVQTIVRPTIDGA